MPESHVESHVVIRFQKYLVHGHYSCCCFKALFQGEGRLAFPTTMLILLNNNRYELYGASVYVAPFN